MRTLADALRQRSDESLAALLTARPDILHPTPGTISELASKATSPVSVSLAVDRLDAWQRQVLSVIAAMGSTDGSVDAAALPAALGLDASDPSARRELDAAIDALCDLALIWRSPGGLRVPTGVADHFGPHPCGLDRVDRSARPRIAAYLADPAILQEAVAAAPPRAREVLDLLLWGPPTGSLPNADRAVDTSSARTPMEWLLARDLVVAAGPDSVVMPREVALLMRDGLFVPEPARRPAAPPPPTTSATRRLRTDPEAIGGMAALTLTRSVAELLGRLAADPPRMLRAGGLAQRDLHRVATGLRLDNATAARMLEWIHDAGLLGIDPVGERWLPTTLADAWSRAGEAGQWAVLALAWWSSPSQVPASGPTGAPLSPTTRPAAAAAVRRTVLRAAVESTLADTAHVGDLAAWMRPSLRIPIGERLPWLMSEFEQLGLTGHGSATSLARALVALPPGIDRADAARTSALTAAAEAALPDLTDHVILQADLTATAAGPLSRSALQRLLRFADRESDGPGGVFRFSAASLRRALDAGGSAQEVIDDLAGMSLTGVPPLLAETVREVARSHGGLRVSEVSAVIRSDDEALIAAVLADRRLTDLQLRRLGSGVVGSPLPGARVLERLRAAGHAPMAEGALARDPGTSPARARPAEPVTTRPPDAGWIEAAVRALRHHEQIVDPGPTGSVLQQLGPHELAAFLRDAVAESAAVWVDYSDPVGQRRTRLVEPLTVRAGSLAGFDHREQRVRSFSLARIAAVARAVTMDG